MATNKALGYKDMEVTDVCGEKGFSNLGGSREQSSGSEGTNGK